MTKIFISGSMRIKRLDPKVKNRIDNIIKSDFPILLGDANGIDASIQELLNLKKYKNVTIFCSGDNVRNNIGKWNVVKIHTDHQKNTRLFFTAKDIQMAKKCDFGFMVWDSKSTGTLSNVYELLSQGKKSLVFVNKLKTFKKVGTIADFEDLLSVMSASALKKAEYKLQLNKKIQELKQLKVFESNNSMNSDQAIAGVI